MILKKPMPLLFITICFVVISLFSGKAQNVILSVHQSEPLQITTPPTEFRILSGNKIVLGNGLTISGGTGNYQKIWSAPGWTADSIQNAITVAPIDTTVYSLKVTDEKGCSVSQLFRVNVIYPIQLECKIQPISCYKKNDARVTLKIIGGAPPYKIIWSNGESVNLLNNLEPGNYTVLVIDDLLQRQEKTFTIKEMPQILNDLNVSICEGSSFKYNGDDLKTEGWYKYSYSSAKGCDSTVVVTLSVNPLPEIPVIIQKGDTLQSSSSVGNQWLKEGVEIIGENKQILVITHSGNYAVNVTNSSECSSQSVAYSAIKTDVPIIQIAEINCKVYPNPNSGLFTVEIESDQSKPLVLELLTYEGKLIVKKTMEHQVGKQQIQFGKTNLADGVYTLRITLGNQTINRKLIVN